MYPTRIPIILGVSIALTAVGTLCHGLKAVNAGEAEARARETQDLSWGLRHRRTFLEYDGYYYGLIGGLAKVDNWRSAIPLVPAQQSTLAKLDELTMDIGDYSAAIAADYLDANPPDYQEFYKGVEKKEYEIIGHAERMVTLGLLTEPQAAIVIQHCLTTAPPLYSLSDVNFQDLLDLTDTQRQELVKVRNGALQLDSHLGELKENQQIRHQQVMNEQATEDATMKILTDRQLAKWALLTYKRTIAGEPPALPALSEAGAAGIKLADFSPIFRRLAEKGDDLKLSAEQQKLLSRLEEITKQGLYWISLRDSDKAVLGSGIPKQQADQVAKARAEFVKQAEQLVLIGILTEDQAKQVK